MIRRYPRLVSLFVVALFIGCASQGSFAPEEGKAAALKVVNGATSDYTVLPGAVGDGMQAEAIASLATETAAEQGWDPSDTHGLMSANLNSDDRKCGDVWNCGPYVDEDCLGASPSCICMIVCPTKHTVGARMQ